MNEWHDSDLTAMMVLARKYPDMDPSEIREIVAQGEYRQDGSLVVRMPPVLDNIILRVDVK